MDTKVTDRLHASTVWDRNKSGTERNQAQLSFFMPFCIFFLTTTGGALALVSAKKKTFVNSKSSGVGATITK